MNLLDYEWIGIIHLCLLKFIYSEISEMVKELIMNVKTTREFFLIPSENFKFKALHSFCFISNDPTSLFFYNVVLINSCL